MSRARLWFLLFVILGLAVSVSEIWRYHGYYSDDSYITLRYTHNLLEGNGLVWNPGERVEGYSNFLFVIILSFLGRLGIDLVLASQLVGTASLAAVVAFLVWYARRSLKRGPEDYLITFLPAFLVAVSSCMVIWAFGGLETVLFSLLVTIGVTSAWEGFQGDSHRAALAGIVLALAGLTRPDGALFWAIATAFYVIAFVVRPARLSASS